MFSGEDKMKNFDWLPWVGFLVVACGTLAALFRKPVSMYEPAPETPQQVHEAFQFPVGETLFWIAGAIVFFLLIGYIYHKLVDVPYKVDWGVDNTALAYDERLGCVLVSAKNTHKIQGDSRHVPGNDPVGIFYYGKGEGGNNLYVVAFKPVFASGGPNSIQSYKNRNAFNWRPYSRPMEFVPRGAGVEWDGFLADEMLGYKWDYIQPKGSRPSLHHKGLSKG